MGKNTYVPYIPSLSLIYGIEIKFFYVNWTVNCEERESYICVFVIWLEICWPHWFLETLETFSSSRPLLIWLVHGPHVKGRNVGKRIQIFELDPGTEMASSACVYKKLCSLL